MSNVRRSMPNALVKSEMKLPRINNPKFSVDHESEVDFGSQASMNNIRIAYNNSNNKINKVKFNKIPMKTDQLTEEERKKIRDTI